MYLNLVSDLGHPSFNLTSEDLIHVSCLYQGMGKFMYTVHSMHLMSIMFSHTEAWFCNGFDVRLFLLLLAGVIFC